MPLFSWYFLSATRFLTFYLENLFDTRTCHTPD